MTNGVDFEVDSGSYIGLLIGDRAGRQTSARGNGWHGSGDGKELAHAQKCDHVIAFFALRPEDWGLRLGPKGECVLIVVYVCVWCREGAHETNEWETNDPAHKVRWGGDVVGGTGE